MPLNGMIPLLPKRDNSVEAIIALQDELNAIVARQGFKLSKIKDDVPAIITLQDELNWIVAQHERDYFAQVRGKGLQAEQ